MKIIVTSGGTSEKIDEVRKITNMASGRLGAAIADEFIRAENAEVTYLHGENAALPTRQPAKMMKIESAEDLLDTLTLLLSQNKYTAIIHAMAVSDYTLGSIVAIDDLVASIADCIDSCGKEGLDLEIKNRITHNDKALSTQNKISSDVENLILILKKTPKIIGRIKELQSDILLVGFKLLDDVVEEELINVAYKLLLKNKCDFVLANDLRKVGKENHEGLLIKDDATFIRLHTKQQIAEAIVKNVSDKIKERN
ncbi:MAG: phosphopantothenoylcysteine decarboxylase [Anaerovoracaceae bacterium]|jgi:phosphopantothenate--cysteine ligase